jgi:hypothetical protein
MDRDERQRDGRGGGSVFGSDCTHLAGTKITVAKKTTEALQVKHTIKARPATAPVIYQKAAATVHDLAIGTLADTTPTTTGRKK